MKIDITGAFTYHLNKPRTNRFDLKPGAYDDCDGNRNATYLHTKWVKPIISARPAREFSFWNIPLPFSLSISRPWTGALFRLVCSQPKWHHVICILQTDEPQEYVITWPEFLNRGLKPRVREAGWKKVLIHGHLRWIVGVFKWALITSFSNDDGKAKENVIWKSNFAELWLFCDYPITF